MKAAISKLVPGGAGDADLLAPSGGAFSGLPIPVFASNFEKTIGLVERGIFYRRGQKTFRGLDRKSAL
jgi:hypothetical protein